MWQHYYFPTMAKTATYSLRTASRYTTTAIALHWLLGALIVGTFILGVYVHDLPFSPARLKLLTYHKWLGITILSLSALRLLWRLTHTPPPLPATAPAWQNNAAHAAHWLLYVLFFAVPITGWMHSSATGFPIMYLGLVQLPDFVPKDRDLAETLKDIHAFCAWALAVIVTLHVAAAFKHQWINRDGLLARMMPFLKK
jgi:cytochrome b561